MLTSRQPIWIGWGRDLIYLYNDPYKSIIGGKHPWALGKPASVVWREIWQDIGPMLVAGHGRRRRHLRRSPAPDHGAQRLSGRNLLHLLLQSDPRRRRHGRRHFLRQHRRHAARHRRAAAGAAARTRRHHGRSPHLAASLRAKRAGARNQSARSAVRDDLHARTGRTYRDARERDRNRPRSSGGHGLRCRSTSDNLWPLADVVARTTSRAWFPSLEMEFQATFSERSLAASRRTARSCCQSCRAAKPAAPVF